MKGDIIRGFVFGLIVAIWLFNNPWSDLTKYRQAVYDCEKSLPRDQHCKVIGVPEK